MEVFLLIGAILFAFWLLPFLRIFWKRLLMCHKLRAVCREKNYSLQPAHRFWLLGSRMGKTCDFYLETPDTVFAVKLFGMRKRKQYLIFTSDGFFRVRNFLYVFSPYGGGARFWRDSKPRRIPNYDFRAGFRDEWYLKNIRPVLLLNPTCTEVHMNKVEKESSVGNGESISGMVLYTLAGFIGQLEVLE